MSKEKTISIIIPALNEEKAIGGALSTVPKKELEAMGYEVEVLVVDGGSKDRTREIAESLGARVIVEPRKGYGRAYKTGFEKCKGDIIVTGDADGTYPFEKVPEMLGLLEDFITTDRFASMEEGAMSRMHYIGNFILNLALRLLYKIDIRDSQSGMWIFRKSILKDLNLKADGMELSEEIKVEAFRRCRAKEVPIHYRKRIGEKKLRSFRDGMNNLLYLFKKKLAE
ncbi:MAG: glycosyltransferase family 2 protein [Candidatus Thermoplasmatota archaeon]|nr:glycosyltransferase family 2 protein [Candidatus Thermoplasmatota archaeon]